MFSFHAIAYKGWQHATTHKLLIAAQCDPEKIFLTSKFSYLLFSNLLPDPKPKTEKRSEATRVIR
jgi:hypothetical protein